MNHLITYHLPTNRDQIVDAQIEGYLEIAEELAGVLANIRPSLSDLPDNVAAMVLEARQAVILKFTAQLAESYVGLYEMLSDDGSLCEACLKPVAEGTGGVDPDGNYLCMKCAMSAWENENIEPKLERLPRPCDQYDPETLAAHVAAAEDWARRRRAFQDSIGVTR